MVISILLYLLRTDNSEPLTCCTPNSLLRTVHRVKLGVQGLKTGHFRPMANLFD